MIYRFYLILFLIYGLVFGLPALAVNESAGQVIQRLHDGIRRVDTDFSAPAEAKASFEERTAALTPLIQNTHDLSYMARITIRSHWASLDDEQRAQFNSAFRDLSVATYARRFRNLADIEFRTVAERPMKRGRIEIQTELIDGNDEAIALNYVLQKGAEGWRIINVLADGVSELALKRSQYQQILKTRDFSELLQHLQRQQQEMERQQPES